jgi:hypothetical protein
MGFFRSLMPGNDHELARTHYAGRESASETAARKRVEKHHKSIARTEAAARRWEAKDRKRFR